MRKDNVWKQAMALVLSAALVFGNSAPVSAATGDPAANDGAGTVADAAGDSDAYAEVTFDFEDGQMTVSGDDAYYTENGIAFKNQCSQEVTDEDGNPSGSEGVEVVDAPIISGDDGGHGKVLKFVKGKTNDGAKESGIDFLTSVNGALAKYDYSNGVTFSFDICPEVQGDWDYLFAFGKFMEYNVTGTIGFIAGYEAPWTPFFPGDNWLEGNNVNSDYNFFGLEQNANKWYTMSYIYTKEGLTITVNGVPAVTYRDTADKMEAILANMSKGQLRLGKGVVEDLEGYVGYMDNVSIKPVPPHKHSYAEGQEPVVVTEPTCTTPGSRRMPACKECGVIETQEIPALGHDADSLIPAKDATCTDQGNIAHYKCKRCSGFLVSSDDGLKQVGASDVKTPAKGHDYVDTITKATAAADGVIKSVCKVCPENTTGHTKTEVINKASNITLEKTSYTYTGKAITPKVTVKDSKGTVITTANYTVSYSNNTKVGTATAKITFKGDKYTGTVNKTFKINAKPASASLTLSKSKVTLYTGSASKTATIKATVKGASKTVTWKSSNSKIAKVDKKGKITAVKAGKATISAKANGITKKVTVTVKNPTITFKNGKKAVKKNTVTVKKKKTVKITVTVKPSKSGYSMKKLSKKDKKVATVTFKKGKITIKGKKKGTVKVKITSGKATKTLTVKVK